jgi:hypothetical protein
VDASPRFQRFATYVDKEKKEKRLHSRVAERLSGLLKRLYPDSSPLPEVGGILGGRNDLIQFFPNGRRVVFELFATVSQVPQDLRLLEQSTADVKIAILLDGQINPDLAKEYFRKKPDHFPYLWLSDVLMPERESTCLEQLREMIESRVANQTNISVSIFEKRHSYYDRLRTLVREAYSSNLSQSKSHRQFEMHWYEFRKQKDEFVLAFGNDTNIAGYVDEVYEKSVDLLHVNHRLYLSNQPASGEEQSKFFGQEKELHQWFYDQYQGGMRKIFDKHLSLK